MTHHVCPVYGAVCLASPEVGTDKYLQEVEALARGRDRNRKKLKKRRYLQTSLFGEEYVSDGLLVGANRPHITGLGREFFAEVLMENNLIKKMK